MIDPNCSKLQTAPKCFKAYFSAASKKYIKAMALTLVECMLTGPQGSLSYLKKAHEFE